MCGIDVRPLADTRIFVICTELSDNPGTSVTNFAEELATLVCRHFHIAPNKLGWVEHYPASESHGPVDDWDWVEFRWDGENFTQLHWRPMRPEDWIELGIAARKSEHSVMEERKGSSFLMM